MIGTLTIVIVLAQSAEPDRALASVTFSAADRATALAERINAENPDWREVLPDCPCSASEAAADATTWMGGASACPAPYHPGAVAGFRTRGTYSSGPGTRHGQQCCYDGGGRLITTGKGAGTPDYWSPRTDLARHLVYDVQTWWDLDWKTYETHWTPNGGREAKSGASCPANGGRRK